MKRGLCLMMVLVLALSLCTGCASKEANAASTTSTNALENESQLLLDHWTRYLSAKEDIHSRMHWVLDYVDACLADNQWESLLKARVACNAAAAYLQDYELPEFTLTQEQCNSLIANGIEADFVQAEYLNLPTALGQDLNTLASLDALLNHDVFLQASWENLSVWSEACRGGLEDLAVYYGLSTNYLLLQLEDSELWNNFPEQYPTLSQMTAEWEESPDALLEQGNAILNQYEERLTQMSACVGTSEYTLQLVQEALDTQDLTYLVQALHIIENVMCYVPMPDWMLDNYVCTYRVANPDTSEQEAIVSGQELSSVPSGYYVSASATQEEVAQYAQTLASYGFSPAAGWKEETGAYQVVLLEENVSLIVEWTEDETVLYMSDPIACLIPELYLIAMMAES